MKKIQLFEKVETAQQAQKVIKSVSNLFIIPVVINLVAGTVFYHGWPSYISIAGGILYLILLLMLRRLKTESVARTLFIVSLIQFSLGFTAVFISTILLFAANVSIGRLIGMLIGMSIGAAIALLFILSAYEAVVAAKKHKKYNTDNEMNTN